MNLMLKVSNEANKDELIRVIKAKTAKLEKLLPQNTKLSWNYSSEKASHQSDLKISGFSGPELRVRAKSKNMFKVIDIALNKLQGRLVKQKHKKIVKHVDITEHIAVH